MVLKINDYIEWKETHSKIKIKFPQATLNDIQKNEVCIICRMKMEVNDSIKLPCGHCNHTNCIQQWISHHKSCPICQSDLHSVLDISKEERNINSGPNLFNLYFPPIREDPPIQQEDEEEENKRRRHHHKHKRKQNTETEKPEIEKLETEKPEAEKPETEKLETEKPETEKPETE